MKRWLAVAVGAMCASAFAQSAKVVRHTVTFTPAQSTAVGPIEKLVVTVDCGWIETLRGIPELYNIEMRYDMPTQNILEADSRFFGFVREDRIYARAAGVYYRSGEGFV